MRKFIYLLLFTTSILFSQSLDFTLDEQYYNKNLEVGSIEKITWESSDVEKINLEYSVDGGKTWMVIITNYPAETAYYDWTIPNTPSIFCKLKISVSSDETLASFVPYLPYGKTHSFTIFGSNKWMSIPSPTKESLTKIKFIDESNGIAWGNKVLLTTDDGGENWIVKSKFSGAGATFVDQNYGWIIRNIKDSTFVLRTKDGGITWEEHLSYSYSHDDTILDAYYTVRFIDQNNGVVVLARNILWAGVFYIYSSTSDGGESWKSYNYWSEFREENSEFYSDYGAGASNEWSEILATEILKNDEGGWYFEGFTGEGWIDEGKFYKRNFLKNEWDLVFECGFKGMKELYFFDSQKGWFFGTQYTIQDWKTYKTKNVISLTMDGGLTWELQEFGLLHINDFLSLDGKNCWAVGTNGTILKYEVNTEQNNIAAKLSLESPIDNSVINLASSSFTEGQNYFIDPIFLEEPYTDLQKEANIFEGTRFSLDEGAIDEDIALDIRFKLVDLDNSVPLPFFMFWGIEVTGEQSGVTSFEDFYKFNEGKKARICIPQTEQFMEVLKELEIDILEIDFAFLKGGEYLTEGIEWEIKKGEEGKPDSVCIYLDHFSQIVGGKNLVTSIKDKEDIIPTKFGLEQNYPNPFNPTTTISYSVANVAADFSQRTSLKIYDVLGKEIKTLVNKQQQAGHYEVNFDASNLSSGIYYYQLKSGSFVETKKMILMK